METSITKKKNKFRFRVFLIIFLVSVSTLAAYTAIASNHITKIQKELTNESIYKMARSIKTQVDQNMQSTKKMVSVLARAYSDKVGDFESFDRITQEIIADIPIITQVYIMDMTGMQIYKSSFPETIGDRSDRDYFQQAIKGDFVCSDVIVSRSTNTPIVVQAQPLIKDDEIIGVIGASVDLGFLSNILLMSYSESDSSYGFIVDSNGIVIGHPDYQKVIESLDLSYLEPVATVLNGETGFGTYEFEGLKKLVSYIPSENTSWGILYQVPRKEAYLIIRETVAFLGISSVIIIISLLIAAIIFSKSLNKPIKKIVGLIDHFSKHYTVQEGYKISNSEFGIIEGELISLTGKIKKSQHELEDKIRDRTSELTKTMDELVGLQQKLTEANKELKSLSLTDKLTGLPNRRSLDDYMRNLWTISNRNKIQGALIMVDIDHFKAFNDTYGHVEGDKCLRIVAEELGKVIKRESDFLARYGGEEFLIVLTNPTSEYVKNQADMTCKKIEAMQYNHEDSPVSDWVTVSAGALFISDLKTISIEDAIKKVDTLLYKAKDQGRNRFVFEEI